MDLTPDKSVFFRQTVEVDANKVDFTVKKLGLIIQQNQTSQQRDLINQNVGLGNSNLGFDLLSNKHSEPTSQYQPTLEMPSWDIMGHRRKFRSQTSDNMDRWKSRGWKSQRREEQKREDQRRERVRGKKIQVREKVAKPRNTVFFQ